MVTTNPAPGKMARPLDPDLNAWDRQPEETEEAYGAFISFRDADTRRVSVKDDGAETTRRKRWSATWQWGVRVREWDRHVALKELDDLVRYRTKMNDRQRSTARLLQSKVAQWAIALNPADLKPAEAAKLLEVSVKMEREAAGAYLAAAAGVDVDDETPQTPKQTLAEVMAIDPSMAAEVAQALAGVIRGR